MMLHMLLCNVMRSNVMILHVIMQCYDITYVIM